VLTWSPMSLEKNISEQSSGKKIFGDLSKEGNTLSL
jgi:hypothetical protein